MKVVLFCGGLGLRMRESDQPAGIGPRRTSDVPKPLQLIGGQPLLWHVMSWYASWGHTHFVLCLGANGELIREWVEKRGHDLRKRPSADPAVTSVTVRGGDMDGWRVDLADTGAESSIGERLRRVRGLVADEPMFLANYADGLSDVPLDQLIDRARRTGATATFLAVPPATSMHSVQFDPASGQVSAVMPLADTGVYINGGFFVLRPEVFEHMRPGEELVDEPFARLATQGKLAAFPYLGFWRACDTVKDRKSLQDVWDAGAPWLPPQHFAKTS